jgi:hypothetical protein
MQNETARYQSRASAAPAHSRRRPPFVGIAVAALALALVGALIASARTTPISAPRSPVHPIMRSGERSSGQLMRGVRECKRLTGVHISEDTGAFVIAADFTSQVVDVCVNGSGASSASSFPIPVEHETAADGAHLYVAQVENRRGERVTVLYGHVGTAVTRVELRRSNARSLAAKVRDGWLLASWPSRGHVVGMSLVTQNDGTPQHALPSAASPQALSCDPGQSCALTGVASG